MMQDHSTSVEWRFAVPPANTKRVVITQRQDGPFRPHPIGSEEGYYYVSVEQFVDGPGWCHVASSTTSCIGYKTAVREATVMWEAAR